MRTSPQGLERKDPLRRDGRAVVLHDRKPEEEEVLEVSPEEKRLVPHGVQGVAVDGLRAEVAAVQRRAQDVHLHARAAGAVARAHVLPRHDLGADRPGRG